MAVNKTGPKRGYKQSADHIAKRIKRGDSHPNFVGSAVSIRGGRTRALRAFAPQPCETCGAEKVDRHHRDGDTANNAPENIGFLCRRCHMEADGRMSSFRAQAKEQTWRSS